MQFKKSIIFFIILPSIFISFFPGRIIIINTLCMLPFLLYYCKMYYFSRNKPQEIREGYYILKIYILYSLITFIRGFLCIQNFNDISRLLGDYIYYFILFPIIIYYFDIKTFYNYIKQFKFFSLLSIIIIYINGAGDGSADIPHMASGFYLLGLMIPYIYNKWKYIIMITLLFVLFSNLGTRTNIINFIFFISILILYYVKPLLNYLKKILAIILWSTPIILLTLGLTGTFNIFKIGEIYDTSISISGGIKKGERNIFTDSRTSIYQDVFNELTEKDAYIWGLSANGKTNTSLVDLTNADFSNIYRDGRPGTESGILNQIQYGGAIGFFIYSILFIYGAYLAIWKSKNDFTVLVGLWISYKYMLSFIEDRMATNIHYLFIIITISICYNYKIRNLDNIHIKNLVHSIFK